ncbi:hypothetical protein OAF52_00700 [bacterium]|nr:hypothetical protein [bacterium]
MKLITSLIVIWGFISVFLKNSICNYYGWEMGESRGGEYYFTAAEGFTFFGILLLGWGSIAVAGYLLHKEYN